MGIKNMLTISIVLLLAGLWYYSYNQLTAERAKTSLADTSKSAAVLESKFNDVVAKEKELANRLIRPSDEPADKFWDRVTK